MADVEGFKEHILPLQHPQGLEELCFLYSWCEWPKARAVASASRSHNLPPECGSRVISSNCLAPLCNQGRSMSLVVIYWKTSSISWSSPVSGPWSTWNTSTHSSSRDSPARGPTCKKKKMWCVQTRGTHYNCLILFFILITLNTIVHMNTICYSFNS